jgi:hypothetical protein
MITFQQALEIMRRKDRMDRPVPFSVEFVTANRKSKKAGDVKLFENMVIMYGKTKNAEKDANHFLNGTVNIMPNGGGPITKIHLMLIRKINNLTVV